MLRLFLSCLLVWISDPTERLINVWTSLDEAASGVTWDRWSPPTGWPILTIT